MGQGGRGEWEAEEVPPPIPYYLLPITYSPPSTPQSLPSRPSCRYDRVFGLKIYQEPLCQSGFKSF